MPGGHDERRESDRIPILGELHGEIMVFEPMTVKEIALDGVQVETRMPLQIDSVHDLRLTLGEHSVVVKGRVVHCTLTDMDQDVVTYRSGLELVDTSARVEAVIQEFLESIKTRRRAGV